MRIFIMVLVLLSGCSLLRDDPIQSDCMCVKEKAAARLDKELAVLATERSARLQKELSDLQRGEMVTVCGMDVLEKGVLPDYFFYDITDIDGVKCGDPNNYKAACCFKIGKGR